VSDAIEWATEIEDILSSYSGDRYYLKAADERGHSAMLHARVQPWVVAAIEEVTCNKEFPYRTISDFVRDAIVHRLHYVMKEFPVPEVEHNLKQLARMQRILSFAEAHLEHLKFLDRTQDLVSELMSKGDTRSAKTLLEELIKSAETVSSDEWREKYIKNLKEKFYQILS
jgi:hypothetical protein